MHVAYGRIAPPNKKKKEPDKMSASAHTTTAILAQLLAGAFMSQAEGPRELRRAIGKIKHLLGDKAETFLTSMAAVQNAIGLACVDEAILGQLSDDTKALFEKLPLEERLIGEMIYARLTGKFEKSDGRWAPPLWRLRQLIEEYQTFSPSKISKEDLSKVCGEILSTAITLIRLEALKMLR